ncbi:MAG: hypothetical protein LBC97_06540, partial [Bifidobacteriaceae bacterium]|nr:hypothetical protein [Bifidobacteriaceae bacterium]
SAASRPARAAPSGTFSYSTANLVDGVEGRAMTTVESRGATANTMIGLPLALSPASRELVSGGQTMSAAPK